jgi:uncharacterized protein YndB with AHSA1/START domain
VSESPIDESSSAADAFVVERNMRATTHQIYNAWTREFDRWFAAPGAIEMDASVGSPFWFDTLFEGERQAHYGRFLDLMPDRHIVQTWVSGRDGTRGAETVVHVELEALSVGCHLRLSHGGFYDDAARKRHQTAWPNVLEHLDQVLSPD